MGIILDISNKMRNFVNMEYLINTTITKIPIYSSDEYNSEYVRDLYKCCVSDALHILTAIFCEQNSQLYFVCSKWIIIYSHTVFERRGIPLFGSTVYCFSKNFHCCSAQFIPIWRDLWIIVLLLKMRLAGIFQS